jgi:hypothetical protein
MDDHTDIYNFSNMGIMADKLDTPNIIKTLNISIITILLIVIIIHQYFQKHNIHFNRLSNLIYDSIYLIIIYCINVVREFVNYQYNIYVFYNTNIFPFYKYLSNPEKTYISECLKYSAFELFRPLCQSFYHRLSFFSYSIKCSNNYINTSRLSYGSVIVPDLIFPSAKAVLNSRNIAEPAIIDDNISFGGLGWDLYENIFKIYYRFNNYDKLPWLIKKMFNSLIKQNKLQDNTNKTQSIMFLDQGLISWSYKNNILFEIKLYQYDKNNTLNTILYSVDPFGKHLRTDVQHNNQELYTDKKNTEYTEYKIPEYRQINEKGQYIIDLYEKHNYKLDTIHITDKDNYTLYFPKL